jgi:6-phosphogluconolactonase
MHDHRIRPPAASLSLRVFGWLLALAALAGLSTTLGRAQAPSATQTPAAKSLTPAEALDQKVLAEVKNHSEVMANLTYLSDIIGSRLTGSPALKHANEWTADRMRSYGLTNVHLEPWTIPMAWERGTASARIVEPDNGRSLSVAAQAWTPGTNGKLVGEVMILTASTVKQLAPYKGKLKNAIILRGAPASVRPVSETGFPGLWANVSRPRPRPGGANPTRQMEQMFRGMMAAQREFADALRAEGVAAILQDAGKPQGLLTMMGSWHGNDRATAAGAVPVLFVAHEHYALLYRLAKRPAPAQARVEIEVHNRLIPGPIIVYNTVGEIRGSEKPDEFVILGAHLDSWDLGQGTTDNGTGSMVVLEAARALAHSGVKPKRTIRFILFTGEEQGLVGSREYVKQHESEMPRISMALVHDTGTGRVTGIGLQGRKTIQPILEKELATLKTLGAFDVDLKGMFGSDHASFEMADVPGFACEQDMTGYRFTHHSQSDTLDKAREPDLIQGAQVMAVAALRVANLPELLPRDKPEPEPARQWVYVGTYTQGKSKGIYRLEFDPSTGKLSGLKLAAESISPSFLAIHPTHRFLYAVNEVADFGGKKVGAVSAFTLNPRTGALKALNQQPSGGDGPCHLVLDKEGKHVLAANYGGGSVAAFPIGDNGRLGTATAFVQHHGSSVNPQRQEGPHAHCINLDAANRFAVSADLGLDKVLVYRYDQAKGTLTPNDPPAVEVAPGAGPRHFAFHPTRPYAYVINELNSTVTAFDYDAEQGVLKVRQTISTLPAGTSGANYPAEVEVHPSGRFLYGSNRGHDGIAVFRIDSATGELHHVQDQTHQIKNPRHFTIDSTGAFLLVANQDGDSVVVFRIDPQTGALTPTGSVVEVPMPVCLQMIPQGR